MTDQFNPNANFASDYEEILDIPGTPTAIDVTYTLDRMYSARFVIFERQRKNQRLSFGEVEVITNLT